MQVYWVNLDPTKGSETKKHRPCLIVQSSLLNRNSSTIIVAPIIPGNKEWPFVVNIMPTKKNQLDKNRHVNLKQLRAVDVSRITKQLGVIEGKYRDHINQKLAFIFNL